MIAKLTSRGICALQALALLCFLTTVAAAQAPTKARIGVLIPSLGRAQSQSLKGLNEELKRLGFIERKNLFVETRNTKGDRSALRPAADDLVARKVDVIFTTGTRATLAAAGASTDIPIVFVHPGNPAAAGLVKSLAAEPPRNLTGVAGFAVDKTEKRLALLKELIPGLREVHIFFDSNNNFSRDNFATRPGRREKTRLTGGRARREIRRRIENHFYQLANGTGGGAISGTRRLGRGRGRVHFYDRAAEETAKHVQRGILGDPGRHRGLWAELS